MNIELLLPFPPSVNKYWRHVVQGKRAMTLLSKAGRDYKRDIAVAVARQRPRQPTLRGRLDLTAVLHMPDNRCRDLDNYPKALLDGLTGAGLWGDDSQIDRLEIVRGPVRAPGMVRLVVRVVEEQMRL